MGASRAARGTTMLCDKGTVTASAGPAIQQGSNVTLSCQLRAEPAWCWAGIFLNSSERARSQGGSVSKTFLVTAYGKHTFTCKSICGDKAKLVCGIDIQCGSKEN